jgi:hypothetical protein
MIRDSFVIGKQRDDSSIVPVSTFLVLFGRIWNRVNTRSIVAVESVLLALSSLYHLCSFSWSNIIFANIMIQIIKDQSVSHNS